MGTDFMVEEAEELLRSILNYEKKRPTSIKPQFKERIEKAFADADTINKDLVNECSMVEYDPDSSEVLSKMASSYCYIVNLILGALKPPALSGEDEPWLFSSTG